MKLPATLEESLNGKFCGLYGEVVEADTYHLKFLDFIPDLVYDVGANVGIFARYARSLFPDALIFSLEPDPLNAAVFRKFTHDPKIVLVEKALGVGQIFHGLTAANGSGETYLSAGLGYPEEGLLQEARIGKSLECSGVAPISLSRFILSQLRSGFKTVIKIDCEGAENCIWGDEDSMKALIQMDYIAIELHDYALTHSELPKVKSQTEDALARISETHRCKREGVHFWARKREDI